MRVAKALGLNRQTTALFAASFLVYLGEEMWSPYLPKYLETLGASVLVIGLWSAGKNLLEGFQYWAGGSLAHELGERGTLALVTLVPVVGYVVFLCTSSVPAAIAASFMIASWESLAGAAAFAVVGSTVDLESRTSAFAIQAIQKRLPKIVGPLIGGFVVTAIGIAAGVKALLVAAVVCAVISMVAQWKFVAHRASSLPPVAMSKRAVWRSMSPFLRRLWWSDVLVRWCDWMARDFIVLYCMNTLGVSAAFYGGLVALQMTTALLTYLPIGAIVRKGHHRPFIGLTFVFFTLVPAVLALARGPVGLTIAFLVYGLREIGEPARKTIITSGFPETYRARGVGLYWSWRAFAICPAPVVSALIWAAWGPRALLWTAFACGVAGTVGYFAFTFRRPIEAEPAH